MNERARDVLEKLTLTAAAPGVFATGAEHVGWRTVFGGQLLAQSVRAGALSVPPGRNLVSLRMTFLAAGAVDKPLDYRTEVLRAGRSFCTCEVRASQQQDLCAQATLTYQTTPAGLDHQQTMPAVAAPDACIGLVEMAEAYRERFPDHLPPGPLTLPQEAFESRFVDVADYLDGPTDGTTRQRTWLRFDYALDDDPATHQQLLTYASDQNLAMLAAQPHGLGGFNPQISFLSLDHCMWFHRSFRADDWFLMVRDCPSIHAGRVLVRSTIFSADGALIASTAQEGLLRVSD